MTQEKLAELMQVDVTTVYRWESDRVEPSLQNILRLTDVLTKLEGLNHPFFDVTLSQPLAAALLDGFAVYRKVNREFISLFGFNSAEDVVGKYAGELCAFWNVPIKEATGLAPEDLVTGDITVLELSMVETTVRGARPLRHSVTVARQEKFSSVLVHQVKLLPASTKLDGEVKIKRRTDL